jgi:hypothetical protein
LNSKPTPNNNLTTYSLTSLVNPLPTASDSSKRLLLSMVSLIPYSRTPKTRITHQEAIQDGMDCSPPQSTSFHLFNVLGLDPFSSSGKHLHKFDD